jgi:hypothetical protein
MVPKHIVDKLSLTPTRLVIGESSAHNEKIFLLKDFDEEGTMYVMGCDSTGKPLKDDTVRFFYANEDTKTSINLSYNDIETMSVEELKERLREM